MITQYPSKEDMNNFKTELMPGEKSIINKLVNFFQNKKDRNAEIYIQPNINGLHPDIIVLEKDCKVWIVEVKDYHLQHYNITKKGWQLKRDNNIYQKFPFRQVSNYKKCFYELLCPELAIRLVQNEKNYGLIKNVVYFHNITKKEELKRKEQKCLQGDKDLKYTEYLFSDSDDADFEKCFSKYLNGILPLQENEYDTLTRFLQPLDFQTRKNISYSKQQQEIIDNENKRQKIYGAAGAGKTLVLAKRAVNFLEKSNWNSHILILTYNISLINYIRDRIREILPITYKKNKDAITILNYHQFIKTAIIDYVINKKDSKEELDFFNDVNAFEKAGAQTKKYDAVFIDEAQDYKESWFQILNKYFLKSDGEMFVVADPKQNIYDRAVDVKDKMPTIPRSPGQWNQSLTKGYRFVSDNIVELLNSFAKTFFSAKYNVIPIELQKNSKNASQTELNLVDIKYKKVSHNKLTETLLNIYDGFRTRKIHPNEIAFVSNTQNYLFNFDYNLRNKTKEETTTSFLQKEYRSKIKDKYRSGKEQYCKNLSIKDAFAKYINVLKSKGVDIREKGLTNILSQLEQDSYFENDIVKEFKKYRENRIVTKDSSDFLKMLDKDIIEKRVELADRPFKFNFYPNSSLVKISTIHSFKGFEIPYLVLVISPIYKNGKVYTDLPINTIFELLYTGLSRGIKSLTIVNAVEVAEIDSFFQENKHLFNCFNNEKVA